MGNLKELYRDKAKFAYYFVIGVIDDGIADTFKSHIKNIPMYIYTNGLIATLAFIAKKSKGKGAEKKSYEKIGELFINYFTTQTNYAKIVVDKRDINQLIKQLLNIDAKTYRKYTLELLSYLEWVVRFAEGMIDDDKDGKEK